MYVFFLRGGEKRGGDTIPATFLRHTLALLLNSDPFVFLEQRSNDLFLGNRSSDILDHRSNNIYEQCFGDVVGKLSSDIVEKCSVELERS